jgi:hypothetical protein
MLFAGRVVNPLSGILTIAQPCRLGFWLPQAPSLALAQGRVRGNRENGPMIYGALFVSGLVACVMLIVVSGHDASTTDSGAPPSAVMLHQN